MSRYNSIRSVVVAFLSVSCLSCAPSADRSILVADTLYRNGEIWTANPSQASAKLLATRGDQIVYVGDGADLEIEATEEIDLAGRFLMPGFIDNHVHFFSGSFGLSSVDLRDAATPDEFARRIADHAAQLVEGEWVLNGDWDHTLWGGELPDRKWIDDLVPDTPVFVMRLDGHMGLANTRALELAGISADTPQPEGGEIVLDPNGELTGVLKDSAMLMVQRVIPEPSFESVKKAVSKGQQHAFERGVVKIHAMPGTPEENKQRGLFQRLASEGALQIRVSVYTPIESWQELASYVEQHGRGDSLLNWDGVKGFVDGSLGSATAWFHQPYEDDENNTGFPIIEPTKLQPFISGADAAGLRLAIHAIGDRAIDSLLDVFEQVGGSESAQKRFRIEHFQHPTGSAIKRLGELGVVAAAHPYHAIDDGRWAEQKIGPARARTTYPFREILDAGGHLSFGSDWTVAPIDPLSGIYAAVTRQTIDGKNPDGWYPQQKITVEEALKAYTIGNAYAGFEEHITGSLEVGKRADLVILDRDPREIAPSELQNVKVTATIVGGEKVYGGY